MSHRTRLTRLEAQRRAAEPEPHGLCKMLFQTRIWAANPRDLWGLDTALPPERPTDGVLYPVFTCFHGDAEQCPHRRWADYCYRRDLHLHSLRDLTEADLLESGPEPSLEDLERQRRAAVAFRQRMSAPLPELEAKLARIKGEL